MQIESLLSEIELLKLKVASADTLIKRELGLRLFYESENSKLLEQLRLVKIQLYGRKSERWESEEQIRLFNEAEVVAKNTKDGDDDDDATVDVKGHTKKRGKRCPLSKKLLREIVRIELPLEERVSGDGSLLREIGKEVSEKLLYEPAKLKVIEYHRIRYGADSGDTGVIAPPVPSIIPKGMATPSLLATIVTDKYADGLPLYRQEEILERLGVYLPRCTMARWVIKSAMACQPIWNILQDWQMASPYMSCDETHVQVLKEKNRKAETKSWMWVRCNPSDNKKIILFDYDPHRSGAVAKRLFLDYKGTLQCDGYEGYNILEGQMGVARIGCNMHGRRKFNEALVAGAKAGHTLAEMGLKFYGNLYDLEERLRPLSFEERHRIRNLEAVPIWKEFKNWAIANRDKVPPQSTIGKAFYYFINQYEYLIGYLKDGSFEMDNGFAERAIKYFAIGRKNWLFSDTEAGAEASSMFYSFVVTAKLNNVNPYEALKKIFEQVPLAKTIEDYERIAEILLTPTLNS
jgi:transposase